MGAAARAGLDRSPSRAAREAHPVHHRRPLAVHDTTAQLDKVVQPLRVMNRSAAGPVTANVAGLERSINPMRAHRETFAPHTVPPVERLTEKRSPLRWECTDAGPPPERPAKLSEAGRQAHRVRLASL